MTNETYQVIAHHRAKPGTGDSVADALRELAASSRNEPENINYVVSRSLEDSDHFIIVESYRSADGFASHRQSDHFQAIGIGRIIPDLTDRSVTAFTGDGLLQ